VARGERPRVAGGLGEPDQQQRHGRDDDDREMVADEISSGKLGDGKSARDVADEGDPVRVEIEQR
jgi:hypothetical protein